MARYVIKPRADVDCDWWSLPQPLVPQVVDHQAIDTGLLNANGNTIWRLPNPIGFGRDDEW